MRLTQTLALIGLFIVLGSTSRLNAQQIQPASYNQLVSRLSAVETGLRAQQQNAVQYSNQGSCDGTSNCGSCGNCGVRGGFFFTAEAVWAKPFFSQNTAYEILDAIPNVGESSQMVNFDWSYESSPRIELGYIMPGSGLGWRARYWQFASGTSVTAVDPGTGRIQVGLQDDPDIEISTGDNEFLHASQGLRMDVLDLEGMSRRSTRRGDVTVSGGLRYARVAHTYRAEFTDITTGVTDDILTSNNFFEGVGPTIAVEGLFNTNQAGWSVYGNARASMLFGDSGLEESRVDPQTIAAPLREYVLTTNDADLQFIGEMAGGMHYEQCLRNGMTFIGRFGGEVQYWPSGGSASIQNGEDDGTTMDPRDVDMGFVGFTGSVGLRY